MMKICILLDQSIGELQMDGRRVTGLQLWPDVLHQFNRLMVKGHSINLLLPMTITAKDLESLRISLTSLTILAAPRLETLLKKPELGPRGETRLFVSVDSFSRQAADRLQFKSIPHLTAAEWVLDNKNLYFAKIVTSRRPDTKTTGVLPYHIEKSGRRWLIFGLITDTALIRMIRFGDTVDLLPFDYCRADCGFLRLDAPREFNSVEWDGASILSAEKNRLLLAFSEHNPAITSVLPTAHGALELLMPSPGLLTPAEDSGSFTRRALALSSTLDELNPNLIDTAAEPVSPPLGFNSALPDPDTFRTDARRYSGEEPLGASGPVVSRHILHPDNLRVVNELVSELSALGYCAYKHSFVHNGQTLYNVIADMPGIGYFRIRPEILKKLLELLRRHPFPWPWPEIEGDLQRELGEKVVDLLKRNCKGPLRLHLEEVLGAYRWLPWWKLRQYRFGFGAQIILVGGHLDSSAERTAGGYNPSVDPAPGMDDNASGLAACLGAARCLAAFRGQLKHTIRFCFFNAEEAGLVGSKAYAAALKSANAPVKATFCTDMIGYNSDANKIFEVHAGYTDPAIRDQNLPYASMVETWAASLGYLQPAQIYKGTSSAAGAPDRNLYDPAINRSDHSAFNQQGYPAILISQDYFANLASEPGKDPNPNYHTANDRVIDAEYGSAIAAAVACAVKELAGV